MIESIGKNLSDDEYKDFLRFLQFIKPYEGRLWNKNIYDFNTEIILFYNEKEWRYLPPPIKIGTQSISGIPFQVYQKPNQQDEDKKRLVLNKSKELPLLFKPENIQHIITSKEIEIPEIIDKIECTMRNKYQVKDENLMKLIITKITSIERIRKDY